MNAKLVTSREFPLLKALLTTALVAGFAISAQALETTAQSSGNWNSITWSGGATPVTTSTSAIANNNSVTYSGGAIGVSARHFVDSGTLSVTSGTMINGSNAAGAIVIGRTSGLTGVLNVNGGLFSGTAQTGAGTGLQIGAAGATGVVNVSSGTLSLTNGVVVGSGAGGTGSFNVSGSGVVLAGTYSGASPFNVGGRVAGGTTASYTQTGGSFNMGINYFGVGYAGAADQVMNSTASITGGSFSANVRVGRATATTSGGGTGTLLIGSQATVTGKTETWVVGATGEFIIELGTTDAFNTINLTAATASAALTFEAGSKLTIDGSDLVFSSIYPPITLISWANGKAPTTSGIPTITFTGFDPQFGTPSLSWTATGLQLNVVPEPSTTALLLGASGLGWVVLRRRRSRQ